MSNNTGKMRRGKSKFIYDFLPYNTFNHSKNNLSGRIMAVHNTRDEKTGQAAEGEALPTNYVVSRIKRHIAKWPNAETVKEDLSSGNVIFVDPDGASYHVYPRAFECDACQSVTSFRREDVEDMSNAHVNAATEAVCGNPRCGQRLSDRDQLNFVAICECGAMREQWVPTCCNAGMRLRRYTSAMANWMWECANDSCTADGGQRNRRSFMSTPVDCPNPQCDNENMEVLNHTASSAFYAQTRNLINVAPILDDIYRREDFRGEIVSDYLLHGSDVGDPDESEVNKAVRDLLGGADAFFDADDEELEEKREEARENLGTDRREHQQQTNQWLEQSYEGNATDLAEELYEHLSLVSDDYAPTGGLEYSTYQQMEANDAENTHLSLQRVEDYNDLRRGLAFDEVRLMKNFPITTITYGYTRTAPEPPDEQRSPAEADAAEDGRREEGEDAEEPERDVELNLFHRRGEDAYAEPQLFYQTNAAEAVLIQFDKTAVLDWLEANGSVTTTPDPEDTEAVREWFVHNLRKPSRYESLPDDAPPDSVDRISRDAYTLLNTTAHLFINAMGALAGHQRESLVERLLPRTMSFVVYKRPDTDFQLGSLHTLFEEQFDDFVSHLHELNDCSIDPVCMHHENGACEDCLYLAAISTENANHNLGRGTVFGGRFDGRSMTGYFEMADDDEDEDADATTDATA
jgi:hypothetical protein